MGFKEWLKLQEVGTGTNAIAMFKRPVFGEPIRRQALGPWAEEDPFFKKRHKAKFAEHGGDPTAYGSTLGSDPDGQSLPSSPLKATTSMAATTDGGQPTLLMPIKGMKKKSNKK